VKKLDADGSNGSEHNDDEWTPNAIVNEDQSSGDNNVGDDGAIAKHNGSEISYKVTNPDGTERRMTKHEKKQLKYKLAQAKREVEREKRQIKHEQLIQEAKKAKYERKKLKRLERQERKKKQQQQQEEDDEDQVEQEQVCQEKSSHDEIKEENQTPEECTFTAFKEIDEELAAMRGDRSGIPPAMLAPAAACVALDMKALKSTKREDEQIMKTMFDRQLTSEWARELKQSMIPAEELREKEDMRPMAYKVIPELWNRLCPKSLCACKDEEMTARQTEIEHSTDEESTMNDESQHSLGLIRNTSPLYDEVANAVFRHLHKYSNLHISSGEIFGCDFLLYDGKREDRHSFAGLRIYTCDKKDEGKFPIPSAYDMTGFVRTMNTARKLALIATVAKDEGEGDTARVLIVDLALEKVLSVPTHKKKGSTEKRKSEIETSSGLAKHKR
jgi:tRNA splicing endonuclease